MKLFSFFLNDYVTCTSKTTIIRHSQIGNKIFFEILIYFCPNLFIKSNCDASLERTVKVRREDKIRKVERIKGKEWIISHFTGWDIPKVESPDEKKNSGRKKRIQAGIHSRIRNQVHYQLFLSQNWQQQETPLRKLLDSTKEIMDVWYIDTPVWTSG